MLRRLGNAAFGPATPAAEQGTPLELISYNSDTKRFELGAEALSVLRKISTPVAVVAVSGRARQGKSFILNQLLGRSTGFVVGPSVRPCTKVCARGRPSYPHAPHKVGTLPLQEGVVSEAGWRCVLVRRGVHASNC